MPRIDEITGSEGGFQFSGAGLDRLLEYGGEFTLASVAVDASGSVSEFVDDINRVLGVIRSALRNAATADKIVLRTTAFADNVQELNGFEPVADAPDVQIQLGGMTSLYDAIGDALAGICGYARTLADGEVLANGVLVVITDGFENNSLQIRNEDELKARLKDARQDDALESLTVILIAVNAREHEAKLKELAQLLDLEAFIAIDQLEEQSLRRLARVVSKSVQAQSQALGSGNKADLNGIAF